MAIRSTKPSWRGHLDKVLKDEKYATSIDRSVHGDYHTYREILTRLDRIVKRFPRDVSAFSIGTSGEGEPIWGFRVVTGTGGKTGPPPRFLVSSVIHAQEFIAAEANVTLLERFTNAMRQNRDLWNREVYFFPVLNPDGYRRVEKDLAEGRRHFARLNRNGVDLNRNFSAFFSRKYFLHRIMPSIWHPGYRPFSEPETSAYREFLLETRFDYALSLHSFGGWLFYPYGGTKKKPREDEWYKNLCREMIDRQQNYGYKAKQLGRFLPFFLARGTETDYLYEVFGTRSLLVEIGRRGLKMLHPKVLFNPFHWFNPHNPKAEIENLIESLFYFLSQPRIRPLD